MAGGFADEGPHLLAILVADVHIGEVIGQLLADLLQPISKLAETLPDLLQVDCKSIRGEMTAADRQRTHLGKLQRAPRVRRGRSPCQGSASRLSSRGSGVA